MAFGSIELTTISRSQDYTTIKQNQDNKVVVDQGNFEQQLNKNVEQLTREVHSSDNSDWQNKKFDAKEKGSNEYSGNGGKQRRKEEKQIEKVVKKKPQSFDMKI